MNNNGLERITSTGQLTNGAPDNREQMRLTQPPVSEKKNGLQEEVERLRLEVEHLRDERKALQRTPPSDDLDGDEVEDHESDDSNARHPANRRGVLHRRPVKIVLALVATAILSVGGLRFLELPAVVRMDRRCGDRWPSRSHQHAHE
jgi:hypothetical protein